MVAVVEFLPARVQARFQGTGGEQGAEEVDRAQTPYQRVLTSSLVGEKDKAKLLELYQTLNPVELQRQLQRNLERLRGLLG